MSHSAIKIDRKCENTYEIFDETGRGVTVNVTDHHLLHLARMLSFSEFYPSLQDHLELTTESWVGTILIKNKANKPPLKGK